MATRTTVSPDKKQVSLRRLFLLLAGSLLASGSGLAQQLPAAAAESAAPAPAARNAIRFDVGGVVLTNVGYNLMNRQPQLLLPIMASYERALGQKFSLVGEGVVNGGSPEETSTGFSVQARWYALPIDGKREALTGFYVAPVVGYRSIDMRHYSVFTSRNAVAGYGAVAGLQFHPSRQLPRLILDASFGVMGWRALKPARIMDMPEQFSTASFPYVDKPYRLVHSGVADGRFGIGWTF